MWSTDSSSAALPQNRGRDGKNFDCGRRRGHQTGAFHTSFGKRLPAGRGTALRFSPFGRQSSLPNGKQSANLRRKTAKKRGKRLRYLPKNPSDFRRSRDFSHRRTAPEDELLGFGVGADDYIRKPYHSSVLLARIARLLKRSAPAVLTACDLTLSLSDMTVRRGEAKAALTKNETRILYCLMTKDL